MSPRRRCASSRKPIRRRAASGEGRGLSQAEAPLAAAPHAGIERWPRKGGWGLGMGDIALRWAPPRVNGLGALPWAHPTCPRNQHCIPHPFPSLRSPWDEDDAWCLRPSLSGEKTPLKECGKTGGLKRDRAAQPVGLARARPVVPGTER